MTCEGTDSRDINDLLNDASLNLERVVFGRSILAEILDSLGSGKEVSGNAVEQLWFYSAAVEHFAVRAKADLNEAHDRYLQQRPPAPAPAND